jgi:MerR family transcriptional regulator, copper efflux regulator
MSDSVPLACSLTAPAAAERAQRWRTLLDGGLLHARPIAGGRRLAFRAGPGVLEELDELVAAERECCPFLTLTVARFDERLILDVIGPPEAASIVDTMFAGSTPP